MHRFSGLVLFLTASGFLCESHPPPVSTNTSAASSSGSLTSASPMLEPRSGHTATLLPDGKVLIVGGMRRNQDFYRSAELYDPATAKFQATGDMAIPRVGHAAVLLHSGKVLIVGGWIGHGATDSAELYDPSTGTFGAATPGWLTLQPTSKTKIFVAEVVGSKVPWMQPQDIIPAPAAGTTLSPNLVGLPACDISKLSHLSYHVDGGHLLLDDGTIEFLTDAEVAGKTIIFVVISPGVSTSLRNSNVPASYT